MPELPDVEGYRRAAEPAAGRRIARVDVIDRTLLRGGRASAIEGERFGEFSRHGKWLFVPAGDAEVLMHFGMTGRLDWARRGTDRHVHDRIVFVCRGGELRYRNMRKFGGGGISRRGVGRGTRAPGPDAPDGGVGGPRAGGWRTGPGEGGEPRCPRCGARLRRATVAGRTTVWCGRCQR